MRRATSRRADTDPTVGPKAEPVPFDRDVEAPLRTKPARTAGDPGASSSDGIAPVRRRATAMFPAGLMTIGLATVGLALSGLLVADFLDRAEEVLLTLRPFFDYFSDILTTDANGEPLY